MHILRAMVISFSVYSKIPVPQLSWKEEDMQYTLCFFPWVGAVIGVCVFLWSRICEAFGIGDFCYTAIGALLPIAITGGFHADGFMDTMDALHSYQPKERKLEILKDSHIGAFAVILFAAYGLLYIGAFSEITNERILNVVCAGFFLSRCFSGIGVVSLPAAKKDGTLAYFANHSQKRIVRRSLYVQSGICIAYMAAQSVTGGLSAVGAALLAYAYYRRRMIKEFGGITGDTAGYFILLCEGFTIVAAALVNLLWI